MLPPLSNYWGGGAGPLSSYAYATTGLKKLTADRACAARVNVDIDILFFFIILFFNTGEHTTRQTHIPFHKQIKNRNSENVKKSYARKILSARQQYQIILTAYVVSF